MKSKENEDVLSWMMAETALMQANTTVAARAYYVLAGKPAIVCKYGNTKKFVVKTNSVGFCNNIAKCQCFRDFQSKSQKGSDRSYMTEKRVETWQTKYGTDNPSKCADIRNKRTATMASRDYTDTRKLFKQNKVDAGFRAVVDRVKDIVTPAFDISAYTGCFRKNKYAWACIECGDEFLDHVDYGRVPRCMRCYPKTRSTAETEVNEFIKSLEFDTVSNSRELLGNLEYDIYIPSKKIAIEYNGTYWHSAVKKGTKYHVNKFIRSRDIGVKLIQIFEDEWSRSPEIVKSRLRSALGVGHRTYARKCKVAILSPSMYNNFVRSHHLQGTAGASLAYGLLLDGVLVAAMSFGKSRYTKTGYELIRYCSAGNVIGGASKLFTYFVKTVNPAAVVSYANRCWSDGTLYKVLGFADVTENDANVGYWYIKDNQRYHRSNFTKGALVKQGFDPAKTEDEIMQGRGYHKIYDCGNYKFLYTANPLA